MKDDDIKRREEQKREAAYDPLDRWRHIQETIAWAEANLPPDKRRNRPRIPAWQPALNDLQSQSNDSADARTPRERTAPQDD